MWDTRYRPLKFSDVLGQQGSVAVLKARLAKGTALNGSYIFEGGAGQGKTTLARIFSRAMLCTNLDQKDPEPCNECDNCTAVLTDTSHVFVEMDAASRGTIDNVRAIVDELPFAVFGAEKRIYLFDECHRLSKDAQDALLKPLEEKKLVGMFCTTEPAKVRDAIRSRCETYRIRKVTADDILARMRHVLSAEGVEYDDDAVRIVIDYCAGHVRDVLNKLEMVAQLGRVSVENVRSYLNISIITTYYEALIELRTNPQKATELIQRACDSVPPDEVASGLAEAAMNSYRLANRMYADFAFVDIALAKQVHDIYGMATLSISEYLLRSRYPTVTGLLCDVLSLYASLTQGLGVPKAIAQTVVPALPVFNIQATQSVMAPAVTGPTVDKPEVQAVAQPISTVVPPIVVPPPPRLAKENHTHVLNTSTQSTTTGVEGKNQELSPNDSSAIQNMSRGKKTATMRGGGDQEILSPLQWKTEFEYSYKS